jgi:hypothetical protein
VNREAPGVGASVDGDSVRVRIRTVALALEAAWSTVSDWRKLQGRYHRRPAAKAVAMLRQKVERLVIDLAALERDLAAIERGPGDGQ